VAPVSGFVTAISTHAGATVTADQTVAVIVPASDKANAGPLEAELWAPSRAIGFVKPGAKVRLMYDAFPVQTFGTAPGVVLDVAGSPTLPKDIPLPLEAREPLFQIRVRMERDKLSAYGQEWTLAPGMRLTADVVLEERSLFDIIFEPVRAARNRFLK
jgi:membrane fusion protein